jgi:hypothetical protein
MRGTEDDTFRILSRPGFDEMRNIHHAWYYDGTINKNTSLRIPFMKKHGWTWLEFMLEANRRGVGDKL